MACILSWGMRIQLQILHDIVKSVFLIITKFGNVMTSHCSVVTKLKYAMVQWTNMHPTNIFTCMCKRHPQQCPSRWVDEIIGGWVVGGLY